jgi:hypothetical protein
LPKFIFFENIRNFIDKIKRIAEAAAQINKNLKATTEKDNLGRVFHLCGSAMAHNYNQRPNYATDWKGTNKSSIDFSTIPTHIK